MSKGQTEATVGAKADDTVKNWYRVWADDACPSESVAVCGLDFSKVTDPPVIDPKTKRPREGNPRAWQIGKKTELTDAEIERITKRLAIPVVIKAGKVMEGQVAPGSREPLGPLGKWLHIRAEGEIARDPDPRKAERLRLLEDIAEILEAMDENDENEKDQHKRAKAEKALSAELKTKRSALAEIKAEIKAQLVAKEK